MTSASLAVLLGAITSSGVEQVSEAPRPYTTSTVDPLGASEPCPGGEDDCIPTQGPPGWTLELQNLMASFSTELHTVVDALPGYAAMGLNFETITIEVYYHGNLPPSTRPIIERATAAGVGVRQVETRHGARALEAATLRLADELDKSGIEWSSITPSHDYGGLEIGIPEVSRTLEVQERIRGVAYDTVPGIAATLTSAETIVSGGRTGDLSPYSGGARIVIPMPSGAVGRCSSGFSMSSVSGYYNYLLTAAHCAQFENGYSFSNGAGRAIGMNTWTMALFSNNALDATLINISPSDSNAPRIYSGLWNSVTTIPVGGAEPMDFGYVACISGATLGSSCNITRRGTDPTGLHELCDDTGTVCGDVLIFPVVRVGGGPWPVLAGGDSGGPVYRVAGSRNMALATVTGGSTLMPCPTNIALDSRPGACYATGWLTPINRVLDVLDNYGINSVVIDTA